MVVWGDLLYVECVCVSVSLSNIRTLHQFIKSVGDFVASPWGEVLMCVRLFTVPTLRGRFAPSYGYHGNHTSILMSLGTKQWINVWKWAYLYTSFSYSPILIMIVCQSTDLRSQN